MAGDDWSREEVEATVGEYFAMLHDEFTGLPMLTKTHRRAHLLEFVVGAFTTEHARLGQIDGAGAGVEHEDPTTSAPSVLRSRRVGSAEIIIRALPVLSTTVGGSIQEHNVIEATAGGGRRC